MRTVSLLLALAITLPALAQDDAPESTSSFVGPDGKALPLNYEGNIDWNNASKAYDFDPDRCYDEAFQAQCVEMKDWLRSARICKERRMYFNSIEEVEEMAATLDALEARIGQLQGYASQTLGCSNVAAAPEGHDVSSYCFLPPSMLDDCEKGIEHVQELYTKMAAEIPRSQLGFTLKRYMEKLDAGKVNDILIADLPKQVALLDAIVALNQHRALGLDLPELEAYQARVHTYSDNLAEHIEKALADVQCPSAGHSDSGLEKTFESIVKGKLGGDHGTFTETVEVFRLGGKPVQKFDAFSRVLYEDAPTIACVTQKKEDAPDTCRIFYVTIRRAKPQGGSWSDWAWHSIGGGERMACGNL